MRLNAFRISKTRVSCLGTSWRRNELITLTLPKSGVARTVCYVNCLVQTTANTKTCLPTNNYGEHRKAPFNLFSATTTVNKRKVPKKERKSTAKSKSRHFFLWTTTNRKNGLNFMFAYGKLQKRCLFFVGAYGELEKKRLKKRTPPAKKKAATKKIARVEKCCAPKIACCAARNHPRGGCCAKRLF